MVCETFQCCCRIFRDQSHISRNRSWRRGHNKGARTEREEWEEERWRKKSIQVLLITTAEKTATKRKMKERGLEDRKKSVPCREDFSGFVFFKLSFCGLQVGVCAYVSV